MKILYQLFPIYCSPLRCWTTIRDPILHGLYLICSLHHRLSSVISTVHSLYRHLRGCNQNYNGKSPVERLRITLTDYVRCMACLPWSITRGCKQITRLAVHGMGQWCLVSPQDLCSYTVYTAVHSMWTYVYSFCKQLLTNLVTPTRRNSVISYHTQRIHMKSLQKV